jgi:hypothetical protein
VLTECEDGFRICEKCLEAGDIDAGLKKRAEELDEEAQYVRNLIGRLKAPTYAEWQAAEKAANDRWGVALGYLPSEGAVTKPEPLDEFDEEEIPF